MMFELRDGGCYPKALVVVNAALALIDGAIAVTAFYQLIRIHSRDSHLGWTRQKVFHLMIGSSNVGLHDVMPFLHQRSPFDGYIYLRILRKTSARVLKRDLQNVWPSIWRSFTFFFQGLFFFGGYFVYFVLTLVAACKGWPCWSHSCGFIVMACPNILFLAAFLLLLSFWVDLCHQANDEDDEDEDCSPRDSLLERTSDKPPSSADSHRRCCSFRASQVGSRQKVVILVSALIFVLMMASAVLIWIGMGKNPIDSLVVARVYVDLFAIAVLLLAGALACYGLLLFFKMSKVRSERASSEMWKVAGLAIVSVLCFTSSACVALFTDIPMLYHWHERHVNGVYTSLLLMLYYFIGSSVPSAFVLWVMRELPPSIAVNVQEESRTIAFITDSSVTVYPQGWTAATSSQNQVSRASPI